MATETNTNDVDVAAESHVEYLSFKPNIEHIPTRQKVNARRPDRTIDINKIQKYQQYKNCLSVIAYDYTIELTGLKGNKSTIPKMIPSRSHQKEENVIFC